jgi:uncharacterized protein YabN with tetrapyrrole methylase and pyrophosphatase domain
VDISAIFEQIKILRHPEDGCDWDKVRVLGDYSRYIAEEAEELCLAIDNNDIENIREELGDLLWNLCFVMSLAAEDGHFTPEEVRDEVVDKMIGRHPHVYRDDVANSPEEALAAFKAAKKKEKLKKSYK